MSKQRKRLFSAEEAFKFARDFPRPKVPLEEQDVFENVASQGTICFLAC